MRSLLSRIDWSKAGAPVAAREGVTQNEQRFLPVAFDTYGSRIFEKDPSLLLKA